MAVYNKRFVFRDVTPCSPVEVQGSFWEKYYISLHIKNFSKETRKKKKAGSQINNTFAEIRKLKA
jgi:hypothetical protein